MPVLPVSKRPYSDPNCTLCESGFIYHDDTMGEDGRLIPGYAERCKCVLVWDIMANMERIWPGLSKAPHLSGKTPLQDYSNKNLWVTAKPQDLKVHLRLLSTLKSPTWYARMITDADIIDVWLRPIKVNNEEIFDSDISATPIPREREIADLVMPPKLLIVRLGVKAARNGAMSENLLDALLRREHAGVPTWVFDQPNWPLNNNPEHLCWSPQLQGYLDDWEHMQLSIDSGAENPTERVKEPSGPVDAAQALRQAQRKARKGT